VSRTSGSRGEWRCHFQHRYPETPPPGTPTAATNLTLSGVISGPGAFIKEGIGIATLDQHVHSYQAAGTVVNAGILSVPADAVLGARPASPADNLFLMAARSSVRVDDSGGQPPRRPRGHIDAAGTGTFDVAAGST